MYLCLLSHSKTLSAHVHPNEIQKIWRMVREVAKDATLESPAFKWSPPMILRRGKGKWRTELTGTCREDSAGRSGGVKCGVSKSPKDKRCFTPDLSLTGGTVSSDIPGTRGTVDTKERMQKDWRWFRGEDKTLLEERHYQKRVTAYADRPWVMKRLSTSMYRSCFLIEFPTTHWTKSRIGILAQWTLIVPRATKLHM